MLLRLIKCSSLLSHNLQKSVSLKSAQLPEDMWEVIYLIQKITMTLFKGPYFYITSSQSDDLVLREGPFVFLISFRAAKNDY